jgi:cellulose synthase (UDP-forming)
MQIVTAFYTMNGFRLETLLLATVSFPIYLRAFWNGIRKKEQKWSATGNRNDIDSPYNYIIPQILIFLFLTFTSVMGVVKYFQDQAVSLSLLWNSINVVVFGVYLVIAWHEHRHLKRSAKMARKAARTKMVRPLASPTPAQATPFAHPIDTIAATTAPPGEKRAKPARKRLKLARKKSRKKEPLISLTTLEGETTE